MLASVAGVRNASTIPDQPERQTGRHYVSKSNLKASFGRYSNMEIRALLSAPTFRMALQPYSAAFVPHSRIFHKQLELESADTTYCFAVPANVDAFFQRTEMKYSQSGPVASSDARRLLT